MMLGSALYYPHIDIDDGQWLRSAVLFWDEIKTIAPTAIKKPYKNKDTKILWQEGFLEPLRCDMHPELIDNLGRRVVSLMDNGHLGNGIARTDPNSGVLTHADKFGYEIAREFRRWRMHPEKLSPDLRARTLRSGMLTTMHPSKLSPKLRDLFDDLEFEAMHPSKMSPLLLERIERRMRYVDRDGEWLLIDNRFAGVYMSALAALLAKEADLAALTNEEPAMGVNLHSLLEDVKPTTASDKSGALVSVMMETIKVDPATKITKLLAFRKTNQNQLAELSAVFEDLSSKIADCETGKELQEKSKNLFITRIRPKLEALKQELGDNSIQSIWEGVQRAVTISVPPAAALAYFTDLKGTLLLGAGAAIAITDVSVKTHLARKKSRRASPFTYLLDVERKFAKKSFK